MVRASVARTGYGETVRAARLVAKACAKGLNFSSSLAGEIARFRVFRQVRRAYPTLPSTEIDRAVAWGITHVKERG